MRDTYDEGLLLSGIIYLHRIIDTRMDGPSLINIRMMKKLCGKSALNNVVLVTTMWKNVDAEVGLKREKELVQTKKFWKDMLDAGSKYTRLEHDTRDDATKIVKSLLNNKPISTRLQDELHNGKAVSETEAGSQIRHELQEMESKLKAELEDARKAMKAEREAETEIHNCRMLKFLLAVRNIARVDQN